MFFPLDILAENVPNNKNVVIMYGYAALLCLEPSIQAAYTPNMII